MPIDPKRESEVKDRIERDFAQMEQAVANTGPGVWDVLQVYGGFEIALRQAYNYLDLLNPTSAVFSTTSSSNIQQ